ncbi:MAG: DNA repair protein RadA [Latescibacteria bacterium DG_63]|nr:MAG: DNA repair protein RadA [Latescibacteria bacterium DG_63]
MKVKRKIVFICQSCGHESGKWFGKCPTCGEWNTAVEEERRRTPDRWVENGRELRQPRRLADIDSSELERSDIGIGEFDRVLGGGLVPGGLVLVGGDPGIGKSTLLLQVLSRLAESGKAGFYVSGEESESQTRMRAGRLGALAGELYVSCETDVNVILNQLSELKVSAAVIDSIQTVYNPELTGAPGSVGQIRECGLRFLNFAKAHSTALFLVGHVTKEGAVAGPRVLEHMVDVVLYLEGERYQNYRVLRAAKNRFGSTNEIGVFEMRERGLVEVLDPSRVFLSERDSTAPGSVVVSSIEGTRPLLVELQALVSRSGYSFPQRAATGYDSRRLSVLLAVLEKRMNLNLASSDVFVNVAGGIKLDEPGSDLGLVVAVASSYRNVPVRTHTAVAGEVGLGGEVRRVTQIEQRVKEATKLGFERIIIPSGSLSDASSVERIEIVGATDVRSAVNHALEKTKTEKRT